jgi:Ca-activated chloride channel family protein
MSFTWPLALLSLLVLPAIVAGYVLLERRRRAQGARFANPLLLPNILHGSPGRARHLPQLIVVLALTVLLVGIARPHAAVSVPREEATVVLAIDTSRSMAATDVHPTRLAAAQAAARVFLEQVPHHYRVGVVAFSASAAVVAPASSDRTFARLALDQLRPGSGTALGDAIARAIEVGRKVPGEQSTGQTPPISVLLLSDGSQTSGRLSPQQAAERAKRLGVRVSTVALGTSDAVVEVPLSGGLKERVTVPPDPPTLKRIAAITGGRFYAAPTAKQLTEVYRNLGSRLGRATEQRELTDLFAGAGGLLLLAGGSLSMLWFQRFP